MDFSSIADQLVAAYREQVQKMYERKIELLKLEARNQGEWILHEILDDIEY